MSITESEVSDIHIGKVTVDKIGNNLVASKQINNHTKITYTMYSPKTMTMISRAGMYDMTLASLDATSEYEFRLPFAAAVIEELSSAEAEYLFTHSMCLNIYASTITHLEWYQTDSFASFIEFVTIAITIISLGSLSFAGVIIGTLLQYAGKEYANSVAERSANKDKELTRRIDEINAKLSSKMKNQIGSTSAISLSEVVQLIMIDLTVEFTEEDQLDIARGEGMYSLEQITNVCTMKCTEVGKLGFRGE